MITQADHQKTELQAHAKFFACQQNDRVEKTPVLYRTTEWYRTQTGADFQLLFLQVLDLAILSSMVEKPHLFSKEREENKATLSEGFITLPMCSTNFGR
jgi:hypothetical protein